MNIFLQFIFVFYIGCTLGWLLELFFRRIVHGKWVNPGFLIGPYLPIYGFGVLTLLFFLNKLIHKKIKIKKINITPLIVFLSILIIVSVIEYFASVGMELLFHKRWWDYSYDKFNLNGRISLRNSSLLAIGAFALIYLVQPILNKFFGNRNEKIMKVIATSIISIISIDFIITILGYII